MQRECDRTDRWTRLKPKTTAWKAVMIDWEKSVCVCVCVCVCAVYPISPSLIMDRPIISFDQ